MSRRVPDRRKRLAWRAGDGPYLIEAKTFGAGHAQHDPCRICSPGKLNKIWEERGSMRGTKRFC